MWANTDSTQKTYDWTGFADPQPYVNIDDLSEPSEVNVDLVVQPTASSVKIKIFTGYTGNTIYASEINFREVS